MKSIIAILLGCHFTGFFGGPAYAEGFGIRDLATVEEEVAAVFDPEFYHWATPGTISLSCCGSAENQIISIDIDRQTDEIGQENRSDEAYIAGMEDVCLNKGMPCKIEEIDAGEGIGRLLTMAIGCCVKGANVILVRDGYRLTIRSAAEEADVARRNALKALAVLKDFL